MNITLDGLRSSKNYREFLQNYLDMKDLSYADFARATGFGRGFPGEIVAGKRRLTAKSYFPFEKALKLPLAGKKFFRCLVAIEESDVFPDFNSIQAQELILKLKNKPWSATRKQIIEGSEQIDFKQLLKENDVMSIYAALGTPDKGANLEQLLNRTGLSLQKLNWGLQGLIQSKLAEKREMIFYPKDFHLFLKTIDHSELLKAQFLAASKASQERIRTNENTEGEFFFLSRFCIQESALPELKVALREVILKFIDESIETEGNRVVQLVTALHL